MEPLNNYISLQGYKLSLEKVLFNLTGIKSFDIGVSLHCEILYRSMEQF